MQHMTFTSCQNAVCSNKYLEWHLLEWGRLSEWGRLMEKGPLLTKHIRRGALIGRRALNRIIMVHVLIFSAFFFFVGFVLHGYTKAVAGV